MARWTLFLAGLAVVTIVTVASAALTARAMHRDRAEVPDAGWDDPEAVLGISRRSLYLNAAASQGLLLVALLGLTLVAGVGLGAYGLPGDRGVAWSVLAGVVLGLGLSVLNLGLQRLLDVLSITYDDSLRRLLTPRSGSEWVLLLVVVLPVVAGFEELLFRGALIGGVEVATGAPLWLLAVVSSVIFAAGHGLQGPGGLLAAGVLGLVLAGGFVATGSLIVVIVAHYVVNTVEFALHA